MESFHAHYLAYQTERQVGLDVTETIVANLSHERGILRTLLPKYSGESLELQSFTATNEQGDPYQAHFSMTKNGDWVYRIGDPHVYLSGRTVFVLRYQINRAMVSAGNKQELYINVNGHDWGNGFLTSVLLLRFLLI